MAKTLEELNADIAGLVTFLPDEDKLCLSEYAAKVPDGGKIVEIGTADGGSAVIMAVSSKPSVKLWTIDPTESLKFKNKLAVLGLSNRVTYLQGKSEDLVSQWSGDEIDLLFIDGMHGYEAVARDISLWGKYVKEDGYVLIHDTLYYEDTVGLAARDAIGSGLLKKEKLLEDDIYTKTGLAVGMLITRKEKWPT